MLSVGQRSCLNRSKVTLTHTEEHPTVADMTCSVFVRTLNLAQSIT